MKHSAMTLDDKYAVDIDQVYLTGTQALVRLPLLQRQLDRRAGLNTAGFISGYRGSPLGSVDIQLWQARSHLQAQHIHFQPGPERGGRGDRGVGGPSRSRCSPAPNTMGYSRSGTARGPGGRPLRRRLQACQFRRQRHPWRGAAGGRRRPCLQILDGAEPERAGVHRGDGPGAGAGQCPGHPGAGGCMAGRCRATAGYTPVSRRSRTWSTARLRSVSTCIGSWCAIPTGTSTRRAASASGCTMRRSIRSCASISSPSRPCMPMSGKTASTASCAPMPVQDSASSHRASRPATSTRRSPISGLATAAASGC